MGRKTCHLPSSDYCASESHAPADSANRGSWSGTDTTHRGSDKRSSCSANLRTLGHRAAASAT